VGVPTERAANLFPVDQLETNANAAASALGFGDDGKATVVVVWRVETVVVVAVAAPIGLLLPEEWKT
jgi:hypothetical protein